VLCVFSFSFCNSLITGMHHLAIRNLVSGIFCSRGFFVESHMKGNGNGNQAWQPPGKGGQGKPGKGWPGPYKGGQGAGAAELREFLRQMWWQSTSGQIFFFEKYYSE
jgi:hypothetical protein